MAIPPSSCSSSCRNPYDQRRSVVLRRDNSLLIFERWRLQPKEQSQATIDQPRASIVAVPPYIILVQGPPKVGKSLLIKYLVDYFTITDEHVRNHVQIPPITVPVGSGKQLQFVECPNDVHGMIDAAKYADMVLLLIDASRGFEMETFEFLNLLHVHHGGFPNIVGILTHLDEIRDEEKLTETKQRLTRQFRKEIYDRAELFYFFRSDHGMYRDCQFDKLAAFMSAVEIQPLSWRTEHPYMLVDHLEYHIMDNKCRDKNIIQLYGYLRGSRIKRGTKVHIAGIGDFLLDNVTSLAEPWSLPSSAKTKGVSDEEKLFYPTLSGLGDAEHIDEFNEVTRSEIEGFRTGSYLRLEVCDVPFQMVKNYDPCHPMLVGGISHEEEEVGYMQARLKRHSWHMRLLKTREPIIISAGWRRYQTIPIYSMEHGINGLHRKCNYTPEHKNFLAMFWGPRAPPNTGLVAVHDVIGNKSAFRISATGVVLDFNRDAMIVKKCKWIKEGGAMQTVSRFKGSLSKAAPREKLMSGMEQVEAPCFFDPTTALLESSDSIRKDSLDKDDSAWRRHTIEQRRSVVFAEGRQFVICSNQLESRREYQSKRKRMRMDKQMSRVKEVVSDKEKRRRKKLRKKFMEESKKILEKIGEEQSQRPGVVAS